MHDYYFFINRFFLRKSLISSSFNDDYFTILYTMMKDCFDEPFKKFTTKEREKTFNNCRQTISF